MANKFLKRAMEIVKYDITTTGNEYASNLIRLKNDAKAVASQMQAESLVTDVQNTYRRIKSGNIVKDISAWFYNNADEIDSESNREDEFDFGNNTDSNDDEKPSLNIPSTAESSKQLSAMYKIGAKQAEAALANTAELVTTINTRTAEIISSVNNLDKTLHSINSTLESKLDKLIQLNTVQIEAQVEGYKNDSMVDESGRLSLGKIYQTAKSSNIVSSNPLVSTMMAMLPAMKENASPENIFNLLMDGLVRNNENLTIKGQTIGQWGQTFNQFSDAISQRMIRSVLENPTIKKYLFNREQGTGGETDYSQYRINKYNTEKALFDNKTRQTIIEIIPGYLKSIDNALNKRELHINEYGKLTTENVQVNKFNAVTDKAIDIRIDQRRIDRMQANIEAESGVKYSQDELDIALKALQATYVMYLERSGGSMLKTSDLNPNDMATINYAVKLIKTARGGSPQYWKTLCQTILLKLSGSIIDGERFIQGVSQALINMRQEAIEVAQGDYGDQAGTITDQMMKNTFRNLSDGTNTGNRKHRSGGGTTGGDNNTPPTNNPPSSPEADAIVDSLMTKLSDSRIGQILGLGNTPAGVDGNTDYIGQITSVASNVGQIGTNLVSAAKDTIKVKGNELIGRAKEAATDKMHEVAERVAFKGVQQDFSNEALSKNNSISDEDKLLVQQIMQMAQTATADGEVSQADINAIKQMIGQIQDANTKKRLNQSIIPMLNRVNSKNAEDGSGQNKGIIGKILAGVTLAFHKILTPIKAILKLGFKGLKTFATKIFAPILKLFKSGASDVLSGGSAVRESLFGSTDENGIKTDGLVQTFITNPAKTVLGAGKTAVKALNDNLIKPITTGISDTFKNIFAERDKAEQDKPNKEEGAEKATDKVVDKFKDFMNSSEFGKGFMSVFNKEEEKKKAAKLKTPESMSDVATNEMSEMISGRKESIFTVIRDSIIGISENMSGKKGKKSGSKSKAKPETASEAVAGEEGAAAAGGKGKVSSLFNIGKMLGGITKILAGFGKMILSAIAGLSGVKAIMTLVEKALSKAVKPLNKAFNTIKKVITPIINTISKSLTKVMDTVSKMAISLVKVLQPIFESIGPIIEMLFDALNPLLEALTPILAPALEVIVNVMKPVLMVITPMLKMITGTLEIVSGSLKTIVGGVKFIVGALKHDKKLKEEGKTLVDSGLNNLKDGLGSVFNPTGAKVEDTKSATDMIPANNTGYQPIKGNVLDGTLTGSGDYDGEPEGSASPIVSVIREELIPQIKPIVEVMTKWVTPILANIDQALTTVGSFVKAINGGITMVKGAVMSGVGFLIQAFDGGKLLKAGVASVKQGFSDAFSGWKEGTAGLIKRIPVVGDIVDVYTDEEGNPVEVLDETGSGNMASYGTYMNMGQRGCGPLALTENINRRGGRINAASLAGSMTGSGSYDPRRGTSVSGYINTARNMGVNLIPGTVTRESLLSASSRNPITVLGSGGAYGTQNGNNHYVNIVGGRGSRVYVSNPLTGRISSENISDVISGSKVGLYGSGDFGFEFSEEVTDAMSELKDLTSGLFSIFKFDDDDDSYSAIQDQREEAEAVTAADKLLESQGVRIADYEEKAYEQFQKDHPKHVWQSDKSYAKKWNKARNKYLLEAAKDDIASAYKAEYANREADSDYDSDGGILDALVNGAKDLFSGIKRFFSGDNGGSTSGSSATAEKFISMAEQDVGKNRSEVNCTGSTGGTDGDWCANYVSQVMKRSGYIGPYNLTVGYLLKAMQESSDWQEVDKKDAARGDVVFFDWDNPNPEVDPVYNEGRRWDHIGWILTNNGDNWTCIEGNAGGAQTVTKQTRYNPYVDTIMRFIADRTSSSGGTLVGDDNRDKIWNYLTNNMGLTKAGAAGVLANMQVESMFEPRREEGNYDDPISNVSYTNNVDSGSYPQSRFISDRKGYGLVQWTTSDHKQNLWDHTKSKGLSIGDMGGQLDTLNYELNQNYFSSLLSTLKSTNSAYDAMYAFLTKFENPADWSGNAIKRGGYANDIYNHYLNYVPPVGSDVFIGPVMPDSLKNVDLNKYDSPIGPTLPSYSEKMTAMQSNLTNNSYDIASAMGTDRAMNTNDEVIFTSDSKGKTFKSSGFAGTRTVGDLYYSKGPWKVESIAKDSGRYNLVSVSDPNFGIDGVPRNYLTLYRSADMVQNNYKPASLYGSGDVTDFLFDPYIDTPTPAQPTYQVVNSSYDGMSREQMISSLSKIEFNVSAKRLESLVEQVIDRLDKKQPAAINIGTKNTNSTQPMFNEEIPNQLMKLYS